ncbi:bifunctional alpha,alpha-trehalose-phosphate synthase (UDP-forming)/trehalose-phosphatase [Planctomycetota bacterium]
MSRIVIIANRLPVNVTKRRGQLRYQPSVGGLATGLSDLVQHHDTLWIGWPGLARERLQTAQREEIQQHLKKEQAVPVFLSGADIRDYYQGFCNQTIWPLFHYFPQRTCYEELHWDAYQRVNREFADVAVEKLHPGDRIWIHDYQLMLLPQLLRERCPGVSIGFFNHIPFPSFELFRLLPWREEILQGLLGADLIGFHTFDYVRHFVSSACRIMGAEHSLGSLTVDDRRVVVDAFPMGIDYHRFAQTTENPRIKTRVDTLRREVGSRRIVLSVDRLDYTKGIVERIEAFDLFLSKHPTFREKVTFILLAVPSRDQVKDYASLRKKLEELVGRVNGEHGTLGWVPIWYLYKSLPFEQLAALYLAADVALVTPLRDGMNLVAKEYLATKNGQAGVLVLSEMAGAASELGEAITVNPNKKVSLVEAIHNALDMPEEEQQQRNQRMQVRLKRYTVSRWAKDFMTRLEGLHESQAHLAEHHLKSIDKQELQKDYQAASQRLILLDHDGTLVDFTIQADQASPSSELLKQLEALACDAKNEVVIVSGRDKEQLEQWYGGLHVAMAAEHGAWIKQRHRNWQPSEPSHNDWKPSFRSILELFTDRTPGSWVEEKDYSLVWHFRAADHELAGMRVQELRDALMSLTANEDLAVYEGNKILEIRKGGINKGKVVENFLSQDAWSFILAAGDDTTDEDMFRALPELACTLKIGPGLSEARYNLDAPSELHDLLASLSSEDVLV